MLKIAFHPVYAHPLPAGHRFPMIKYELIPEQLLHEGIISEQNLFLPEVIEEDIILLTHDKKYWNKLKELRLTPAEARKIGFPITRKLIEREARIAQGTIDCCYFAFENGISFNVAGGTHHSGTDWGEGFCMLNDQAIAANYLLNIKLAYKILIIDLDVHQGNGTAQIFDNNPDVFTFSMHGEKNFPFRKERSDWDIGLRDGIEDAEYLDVLDQALNKLFENQQPDFVFYLAGADILDTDKLGKLSISRKGCKKRDFMVLSECQKRKIPVQVSMGEGILKKLQTLLKLIAIHIVLQMIYIFEIKRQKNKGSYIK